MSDNENSSVWKIILSVCVTIFLFIRIAVKCSGMNNSNSSNQIVSNEMDNLHKIMEQSRERATEMHKTAWKSIYYTSYKKMDSMGSVINDLYGIKKLDQDSLIRIDIKSKIRIPKESFYLNNYDDSLRFAVKFYNGTNFLMHDVESKESVEDIFRSVKGDDLYDLRSDEKKASALTILEYKLRKTPKDYNGIVAISNSDGLMNFIEFENPDKSSTELKMEMTKFLLDNLVEK